jgi:hypothetical protein
MTVDLVQSVFMGLCGPLALVVILRALPLDRAQAWAVGLGLAAWFLLTALTSVPPLGRVPGALFGIILPVVAIGAGLFFSSAARTMIAGVSVAPLVGLHVTRLAGGLFIVLAAQGRLSNPFASIAGWGDILAALTAIPAAIIAYRARSGWEKWVLAWNIIGFADFISAITLGITSQPGSPVRLFLAEPGTAILGQLPWRFIPSYFVPLYMLIHIGLFIRLVPAAFAGRNSPLAVRP